MTVLCYLICFQQNTKQLRLLILLQASIVSFKILFKKVKKTNKPQNIILKKINFDLKTQEWEDPELAWDTSVYKFDEVILPVDKIWTPELLVTNA